MPSRAEVAYFGAGPAPVPTPVIEDAAKAIVNYNDCGMGLGEISHRSPAANKIIADAKASLSNLLEIPDNYEILFMQGGGSGGYCSVIHNLVSAWVSRRFKEATDSVGSDHAVAEVKRQVDEELKLDYLVTGSWSLKAVKEAQRLLGEKFVNIVLDSRESNGGKFGTIPAEDQWNLTKTKKEGGKRAPAFVYFCDNETVDGIEFPTFPKALVNGPDSDKNDERLVVADMSSNFLSRKIDVNNYAVIFGGAQKNIGIAGITITIVRKDLLPPQTPTPSPDLIRQLNLGGLPGPIILDYATVAKNNSLFNTLPIFNLWIAARVMGDLEKQCGAERVSAQEKIVNAKANLLYGTLDKYPNVYQVVPDKSARSRMNACFRVHGGDADKEKEFVAGAEKRLLMGVKGHRSVGGMRVSNYNAVPLEHMEKLVAYINEFASQ